ncbi:MAG: HD domain-containing protein [Desulfobacteraceae bacterium]|nr:HD domain-containing protein [Desulfobacteraceae bacterium]
MSVYHQTLLIVSNDRGAIKRLKEIVGQEGLGYYIATRADEVCASLERNDVDLVLIDMQGATGLSLALLQEIRKRYPGLPIITIAGIGNIDAAVGSLEYGAYDYVTKPFFSEEVSHSITRALEKRRLELKLKQLEHRFDTRLTEKTEEIRVDVKRAMAALSLTLEASDMYTAGHSRRVSEVAMAIGRKLGLDEERLDDIRWGGLLHDIGKIAIDRSILNKPSKLTGEEYAHVMTHPVVGATIVSQAISNVSLAEIIEYHHCFYNGCGYGQTVRGENIPLLARIVAIADAYEAMTSLRPYRPALSREEAIAEIMCHTGSQFDPIVADMFLKLSINEIAEERNKVLVARDEQSDRLLLKSALFNKYARAEWLKDLCP